VSNSLQQSTKINPDAITRLFKEAYDTFPPLIGKLTSNNLLAIRETLLLLHMVIPHDQLKGIHSLTVILTEAAKYKALHGNSKFVRPSRLPLYDRNITIDTTTSHLENYTSYEAAKCDVAKFLEDVINEIWYSNLKDAKTFYRKVTALEIMAHLDANSKELHAIDMISLRLNMTQYYVQVDGIPQFIVMMEDAQKKASGLACLLPMLNS
jgi:hypothetical protein